MRRGYFWQPCRLGLLIITLAGAHCGPKLEPDGSSGDTEGSGTTSGGSTDPNSTDGGSTGSTGSSGSGSTSPGTTLCGTQSTKITYSANAASVINTKCAGCHSPKGSKPNPDLSTYANASSTMKGSGLTVVDSGEMPPSNASAGQLTTNEKCIIDNWAKGGYAQ